MRLFFRECNGGTLAKCLDPELQALRSAVKPCPAALLRAVSLGTVLRLPTRKFLRPGDQACSVAKCEIRPRPLTEDRQAIAEADEKEDVNGQPGHPCGKAAPVGLEWPLNIRDSGFAADSGHVALVEVMERLIHAGAIASKASRRSGGRYASLHSTPSAWQAGQRRGSACRSPRHAQDRRR